MTALHAIPFLPHARERELLNLRKAITTSARGLVETEERYFGELERPEIKSRLEDRIVCMVPSAMQWQVDLFVNHALTVTHGDGPNQALADLLAGVDQVQSPLDFSNVYAILKGFVPFADT